ncbi:MAG: 2-oxo acid dehydrogenase subunit E2 [Actinomycetia bacterium]|nr:2-oxo acid dehydrogenase subunit E2 [Actinomycetes bacterium]
MCREGSAVPTGEETIPFRVADRKREGDDITVVATSGMVGVALDAAERLATEGISAEVIDPPTLRPLDEDALINSARKTSCCIVIDEGYRRFGATAELAAAVASKSFYFLDAPVERIGAMDVPVPFAPVLEDQTIPTEDDIVQKTLAEVQRSLTDLASGARAGGLQPRDVKGGTFTLTNLCIEQFTAILNPPEVGILAVGTIREIPSGVNGDIALRPMIQLTLCVDHRAVDEFAAAAFLKEAVENPREYVELGMEGVS